MENPRVYAVNLQTQESDELPSWFNPNAPLEQLDVHLRMLREFKRKKINQWREAANFAYFVYKGKRIACDRLSRSDIDGTNGEIIGLTIIHNEPRLPLNWIGKWKAIDNEYVDITTVVEWKEFYSAMFNCGTLNFAKAQYLKAIVESTGSLQDIMNITWETKTPYDMEPDPLPLAL